ncbi:MAG: hypothetical protein LW768_14350 [Rubrivivax sp.]|jgi:hypothetical protein|nr:hypothetical protein [Rubrivivax sp.]
MNFAPALRAPSPWRRIAIVIGLACASLAGCGPGVGGTGTGNEVDSLTTFGAMPAAVCSTADFSQLLACAANAGPGSGTALVLAADGDPASRHLARFEGSRMTLELRCSQQQFVGDWAQAAQLGTRYFGSIASTAPGATSRPASVIVTAQGNNLVMLVQDFAGTRIGELLVLQRVQSPTTPASCG